MELNDLKASWSSLDERLKKQENVKETILKQLICNKGAQSLSWLVNYEWFGLVVVILAVPIIPFVLFTNPGMFKIFSTIMLFFFEFLLLFTIGTQVYKIKLLSKIDYSERVENNVRCVNRYNLFIKKEKILAMVVFVLLIIFYISRTYLDSTDLPLINVFIFFLLIFVAGVVILWQYKVMYSRNINSIQKSLDELKELEEEEE